MTANTEPVEIELKVHIQDGSLELPVLPAVTNQVIQIANNPESTSKELAELLQRDQGLASHTMRFANSAAYSSATKLVSLQQAITLLGMQTLTEIALASSLSAKLFNVPGYERHAVDIWRHALATALWSKELARITRRNVDATFLAGLLHSIGRPVVLQAILKIALDQGITLTSEEVVDLENRFQCEVGLKICVQWKMPPLIHLTVQYLHDYQQAPEHNEQVAIINGATSFALHMLDPAALSEEQLYQLDIIEQLHLYDDELEQLLVSKEKISNTLEMISK